VVQGRIVVTPRVVRGEPMRPHKVRSDDARTGERIAR